MIVYTVDSRVRAQEPLDSPRASDGRLLPGLVSPILTGGRLWGRSLGSLARYLIPLALLLTVVAWTQDPSSLVGEIDEVDSTVLGTPVAEVPRPVETADIDVGADLGSTVTALLLAFLFAFSIALIGVVLSQCHTGRVKGNLYFWTLKRLVPWAVTWSLVLFLTFLGFIAFIVPGIIIGLRLFWADELALIHGAGPIRALKESWQLTKNAAGAVFGFQFLAGLAMYPILLAAIVSFVLITLPFGLLSSFGTGGLADIVFTFIAVLILFITYGALHAPELAYFYGIRAARAALSPAEAERADWLAQAKLRCRELTH